MHRRHLQSLSLLRSIFGICYLLLAGICKYLIRLNHLYGKTPQIPCVSIFCNPRTVEPTYTFQEQLIVAKKWFLAARNNISISQAAQSCFILLRAARNNIGCFSHVTKLANMRVKIHHSRATHNYWFSAGVVKLLTYRCNMSPGFAPIVNIPKQHKIEHLIKKQCEILKFKIQLVIIIICVRGQHKILC